MARISAEERVRVRQNLLNTAAEHFAREGFDGASINRISVAAGYAKGTVYGYFDSKDDLFRAVLEVGSDETIRRYRERGLQEGTSTYDKLVALVEADVALVQRHEPFMRVMARELISGRPETRRVIEAGAAPLVREVVQILLAGRSRGEVRGDWDVRQQATLFTLQLTMLYVQRWHSDGRFPTWEELPEMCATLFLHGVGADAPAD